MYHQPPTNACAHVFPQNGGQDLCETPQQQNKEINPPPQKNPNADDAFTARYDAVVALLSVSLSKRPARHFSYSHTNVFHLHKSSSVQAALLRRRVQPLRVRRG